MIALSTNDAAAQGVVFFGNQPLRVPIFDVDGVARVSGTRFVAQLLYQNNSGTWIAHSATASFYDASFVSLAGYWNGSGRTLVNAGGINPTNPIVARSVNMQVRVWDGGPNSLTFDEAAAAGMKWGTSDVFVYIEEYSDPRANDDFWMKNFQGFSLVPEPSAWALFALGMGWVVWRNRKGKS